MFCALINQNKRFGVNVFDARTEAACIAESRICVDQTNNFRGLLKNLFFHFYIWLI